MIKPLLLSFILFMPLFSFAQNRNETTRNIDTLVSKIERSFTKTPPQSLIIPNNTSPETYRYLVNHSKISFISIQYKTDSTAYEEKYYLDKENLIYTTLKETTYYNKDKMTWSGSFYFSNYKLIYYQTLGHGKSETKDWDPQKEVLKKFDLRMNELKAKIK